MSISTTVASVNSEIYYVFRGRKRYSPGTERAILWHHGAGGEWNLYEPQYGFLNGFRLLEALANSGYTVLSAEFGGAQTWGNSLNQTRITAAVTWLGTQGCRTDKVGLLGASMGFTCLAKWARNNTAKVAAFAGLIPCTDAQWAYDNNGGGLQAPMNAAYSPSTWAANASVTNPSQIQASLTGFPVRAYYANDDTVVGPATAPTFANLVNAAGGRAEAVDCGTGGHSDIPLATIDVAAFLRFYQAAL